MCGTCGCDGAGATIERPTASHHHQHGLGGHAHNHAHLEADPRVLSLEIDLLAKNDAIAARNRALFAERGIVAVNLMSSPGAGKTSLLVRSLERLAGIYPVAVIEGDQATAQDAERIRACGVPAVQINTGKGCHLDAEMIEQALPELNLPDGGILFIENVGNLVCPAGFDLGERWKVVIASVTEGEDKPLKYPGMFAACDLMLVSKCDLLPALRFDVDRLEANARRVKPEIDILRVSAETPDGLAPWFDWLKAARVAVSPAA